LHQSCGRRLRATGLRVNYRERTRSEEIFNDREE
jgi:hypothetical protein